MQKLTTTFEIDGQLFPPPVNWQEIQITSKYDDDNVQATLDIDSFRFVNETAVYIKSVIEAGKNGTGPGIFQALPFKITISNGALSYEFNGYLDLTTYHVNHPTDISVKVGRLDATDIIQKLQSITYELLKQNGYITSADYTAVDYVVEKEFVEAEFLMLALTTFLMARETAAQARVVASRIAELAAAITMFPPQPSQIAKVAVLLLLDLAYAAALIIALVKLVQEVVEFVLPPTRTHQGITFLKALQKAFDYFGYTFSSPIIDLADVYVPSKPEGSSRENEGIPNPQDVGYRCSEMLDLCKQMFNARIKVDEVAKTVELRSLNDPFWQQSTAYVMPDHLDEEVDYNTNDIVQTRLVTFTIDPINYLTIKAYKGTAYEVTTEPVIAGLNVDYKTIRGLDEIRIPLSLGVRKDNLTDVEKALLGVTKSIDAVLGLFGASTGISAKIRNRNGLLRQGTRYHSIPQIVLLEGGKIPANYRDRLSARYLYNTYINQKSLVANNFFEQKSVYNERVRAMGFTEFMQAIQNKYFTLFDGRIAEFTAIKWAFDLDKAVVDYRVHEVYTKNLQESFTEPE